MKHRPQQPNAPDPQAERGELQAEIGDLRAELSELRAELALQEAGAADRQLQLERYAADLRETFKEERARTQELHRSYMATVRALANAVEARDAYTGKHAERVAAYAMRIAEAAGFDLGGDREIEFGFLLHDIGKVAVPDAILFKPARLTANERLVIEQHPLTGVDIVRGIDFLGHAREVIRHHHERFDGTGYPDRLRGEAIPLSARVFAVADVLDALTTERPYRTSLSMADARLMIEAGSDGQFDPAIIAAFSRVTDATFAAIAAEIS